MGMRYLLLLLQLLVMLVVEGVVGVVVVLLLVVLLGGFPPFPAPGLLAPEGASPALGRHALDGDGRRRADAAASRIGVGRLQRDGRVGDAVLRRVARRVAGRGHRAPIRRRTRAVTRAGEPKRHTTTTVS